MRVILLLLFILAGCNSQIDVVPPVAPQISTISAQSFFSNSLLNTVAFSLTDADSLVTCSGSVSATSSNQSIVHNSDILISGTAPNCILSISPVVNAVGVVTISLNSSDSELQSNSAFSLTISSANTNPTISNISNQSTNEDTLVGGISFSITDAETSLICSSAVSAVSSNQASVANASIVITGTAPNCLAQINPVANAFGVATITLTVSDGILSSNDSFDLTINAVDDAPVAAALSPAAFNEDTQSLITLSYADAESDLAATCALSSLSHVSVTQACACAAGTCMVGVTGISNYNGAASFQYSVTANSQTSNLATATLNVLSVNDAPVASNLIPSSFNEDTATFITFVYNDADSDLAASCSVSNLTNVTVSTACACSLGSCSVGIIGTANYNGPASFDYTVTANSQTSNSASSTLTIDPVDDAPVASALTPAAFNEDAQSVITLSYSDLESNLATACTISNLSHVTVTQACACAAGTCSVGVTSTLSYSGAASFDYTVTANGLTSLVAKTATFTINPLPATITSVTTTSGSGTYTQYDSGDPNTFTIVVGFSKNVVVTGTPKLTLNVSPQPSIGYASGSGTNALTFFYTVSAGDSSNRLDYASTTALSLNGGTIKDVMGYNATLTLGALNSSGLYTKNIKIDAAPPVAPTNLGWINQTIYDLNATARWTVSSSADLAAQSIQLFQTADCGISLGAAINLASASQSTYSFSASSFGSAYSYKIISYDALGNPNTSSCSSALSVAKSVTGILGSVVTQNGASCALVNGGVQCWGHNQYGALGNSTTNNSNVPVQVTGLTSGVQAIAVGYYHACAIVDGAAKCWGYNTSGQLGDGTTTNRSSPVAVSGLTSGVQAIAAGQYFTCALQNGSVKCWGSNQYGQIGNSTVTVGLGNIQTTPLVVSSPLSSTVQDVKAFGSNVCALANGKVYCWGINEHGQLGNNTITNSNIPVQVLGITLAQSISTGGFHSCALQLSTIYCWGRNTYYQLGDGTNVNKSLPVEVTGLTSGVQAVSAGHLHTCVIVDGVSKCWGYNASGQVGDNTLVTKTSSTNVLNASLSSFSGTLAISSGVNQTCANINGAIKCWGDNFAGTLGNSSNTDSSVAVQTTGLTGGTQAFASGAFHSCVVINGGAQCWGRNNFGQLGNGTTTNSSSPVVAIAANSGVHAITVGEYHTCALVNGGVKCWGLNDKEQITSEATDSYSTPQTYSGGNGVDFSSGVQMITAGLKHTCAIKDGNPYCWGDNSSGILGVGSRGGSINIAFQIGLNVLSLIGSSSGSSCATSTSGRLMCWGANNAEPLASYGGAAQSVYGNNPGIQSFEMNDSHICAVVSGAAECWGLAGALGDGTTNDSQGTNLPVVGLSSGVQSIAVSNNASCAIVNGAIKCWGTYFSIVPVATSITSGAQMIKGNGSPDGFNNTCAMVNGGIKCWGVNTYGQLGNGTTTNSLITPVQVLPWQ